jgi:hypothetical protein
MPREKMPTRGTFLDNGNWMRVNIGIPKASMITSEEMLKTAFVIRWLMAVLH